MRSGRLLVKADADLTPVELRSANHVMLGRTDNHRWLRQADRRLLVRHVKGRLQVHGETYLGKGLVAAVCQPSPWNRQRLLGVVTYQQVHQMRGMVSRLFHPDSALLNLNLYDAHQRRFIRQETAR
jgi:hypothetical protein